METGAVRGLALGIPAQGGPRTVSMPRTKGDDEARRRDVSEAVWRVLAAHGFGGLTMRAVAAELGATTGLLTHYFPAKRDLVAHALDLLELRTATATGSGRPPGTRRSPTPG